MLQRLPIAFAQVKADNTSDDLLNKIRQIVYSLYWVKEITKKVLILIWLNQIQRWILSSWIQKIIIPPIHSKIDLRRCKMSVALLNLSIYYDVKTKTSCKFKILVPTCNDKFELPDRSYSTCDIQDYFEYIIKKYETITNNPLVKYIC